MKKCKLILLSITLALSTTAYSHTWHSWQKIKTERGDGNWVICKWKCDGVFGKGAHTTETSGRGSCPQP
jgi:hypothetical protein